MYRQLPFDALRLQVLVELIAQILPSPIRLQCLNARIFALAGQPGLILLK